MSTRPNDLNQDEQARSKILIHSLMIAIAERLSHVNWQKVSLIPCVFLPKIFDDIHLILPDYLSLTSSQLL